MAGPVDLNADVGEGCDDAALVPLVSSVNVSCGAHAGDDATGRATIRIARAHDVVGRGDPAPAPATSWYASGPLGPITFCG